jgi:ornithine decarboxylase
VVFEQGERVGYRMKVLDIGGGFQDSNFEKITFSLRRALMDFLPGTCVIAEPGRYYTRSAYTLACKIISRRVQLSGQVASTQPDMLYQNDGVYGNFMNVLIENEKLHPALVLGRRGAIRHQGKYRYSIWGPTCDSVDCVAREVTMDSEVLIGDWLKYKNMGGKSSCV